MSYVICHMSHFQNRLCYKPNNVMDTLSIIVQKDATIYGVILFLQTALHVSGYNFIHHQEHT